MKLLFIVIWILLVKQNEFAIIVNDTSTVNPENECAEELHIEKSKVPDMFYDDEPILENDKNQSSLLTCIWKKRRIIDADGKINVKNYNDFLEDAASSGTVPENDLKERIIDLQRCSNVSGNSSGLVAVRLKNCIAKVVKYYQTKDLADIEYLLFHMSCEEQLTFSHMKKVNHLDNTTLQLLENIQEYQMLFACIWHGRKVITEDGEINTTNLAFFIENLWVTFPECPKQVNKDIINNLQSCKNLKGTSIQDAGIKLKKCLVAVASAVKSSTN